MPKFKIKENQRVMMAYIYEVEAETKEEAVDKYINELAGSLPELNSYVDDGAVDEDIVAL